MPTSAPRRQPPGSPAAPAARASRPLRVVRSPVETSSALEVNRTAAANVHAHTRWLILRVVGLVTVDLASLELLRVLLAVLESRAIVSGQVATAVTAALPAGFLGSDSGTVAFLVALWATGTYGYGDRRRHGGRILLAAAFAAAIPIWAQLWSWDARVLLQYAVAVALTSTTLVGARLMLDRALGRLTTSGRIMRAVLVGPQDAVDAEWERRADEPAALLQPVARVPVAPAAGAQAAAAELGAVLAHHGADTVLLCGDLDDATFASVVRAATVRECRVLSVTRRLDMPGIRPSIVWDRGQPVVQLRSAGLRGQQLVLKRLLDIVLSSVALVIAVPVMLAVAAAVRLGSAGPAIYGQSRLGRHGRDFRCYKFRSMYPDAEERLRSDPALYAEYVRNDYKLPDGEDPRITRVGRLLRKTSLDELPQLWNVLKGDMSLVGPRPIVPNEICHYVGDEHMLLLLKPGITGSWQVSGRSNVAYPQRSQLELEYVEGWSLGRDISILLRTLPAVLLQRGAH